MDPNNTCRRLGSAQVARGMEMALGLVPEKEPASGSAQGMVEVVAALWALPSASGWCTSS